MLNAPKLAERFPRRRAVTGAITSVLTFGLAILVFPDWSLAHAALVGACAGLAQLGFWTWSARLQAR